jgi:hypothetical protein
VSPPGGNEHRSPWEELNHNCPNRYDEHTRWRVGTFAQSLAEDQRVEDQHVVRGAILAEETDAYLRLIERRAAAKAEGLHQGEPGE